MVDYRAPPVGCDTPHGLDNLGLLADHQSEYNRTWLRMIDTICYYPRHSLLDSEAVDG